MRYREDLPNILSKINLVINSGEKVGIIGRAGSGKSTIFNTLIRIAEISKGEVYIDGI